MKKKTMKLNAVQQKWIDRPGLEQINEMSWAEKQLYEWGDLGLVIRVKIDYYGNKDYGKRACWIQDPRTKEMSSTFFWRYEMEDNEKSLAEYGGKIEYL